MLLLKFILVLIAGLCDGLIETLLHHYGAFKKHFPKVNDQYWNPSVSCENKYKSKLPFAKTALVFLTDAYHLFRSIMKWCLILAITLPTSLDYFTLLLYIAVLFVSIKIFFTIGFYITYEWIYP